MRWLLNVGQELTNQRKEQKRRGSWKTQAPRVWEGTVSGRPAQKTELSPAGSVEQGKIWFLVFVFLKKGHGMIH